MDGGAPFAGAQCASVRGLFTLLFLGCSFTAVSRVLEVAAAGLHVGVRAAAAVAVGVVVVAAVAVGVGVDVNQILGLLPRKL